MGQILIDGQRLEFSEGETILNIARKNGIFIPAICYLSGCSATLACRLCMVEVDGKVVYSCNAKAKDGMEVISNSPELNSERRAIMQAYCINHPLECGVCDQSGECELQNFTHYFGVNEQIFVVKDSHKPPQKWGFVEYDPSLCIVCERCVKVCKDKIGDNALKTLPREAEPLDKSLKDTMPKDAFAVLNKAQKSLIGRVDDNCSNCGECAAVCPVGALTESHFKYTTNAWELRKIPASNPHSSDCELIYYEVKESGISNRTQKIYRVSNDFHFGEINGAARFGYEFNKPKSTKNRVVFERIIKGIQNGEIKTIKFNSFITNEEAKILQLLKERFGLKLINDEAKAYKEFLHNFSLYSGKTLYSATTKDIINSDFIVVAGSFLRHDAPNVSYKVNNALKINKASGVYCHTIFDKVVESYSKNFKLFIHEANKDIEILLWILANFAQSLPLWLKEKVAIQKELIELDKLEYNAPVLIIGDDFIKSENSVVLAKLLGLIERFTNFKVFIIPPRTNSLGVRLICELDDESEGEILGYNESGDIVFGALKSDLDAPALSEQEGTFTNYDKKVVPTNAALEYKGFELNDIANALGIKAKFAIDYTSNLGECFENIKFDNLTNYYDNGGVNHRGYEIKNLASEVLEDEFDLENRVNFEPGESSEIFYLANPINQFSKFTAISPLISEVARVYAGSEFLDKHSLKDGDILNLTNPQNNYSVTLKIKLDKEIDGVYIPEFDAKIESEKLFNSRYSVLKFTKDDTQNLGDKDE